MCRFRNSGVLQRNETCHLLFSGRLLVAEAAMSIERVFIAMAVVGLVGLVSTLAYALLAS
jgi:hypothetical protein